jgi:hypothetical protein
MKTKSAYALISAAVLAVLVPVGAVGAPEPAAGPNPGDAISVRDALGKGLINLRLEGQDKAVHLVCSRGRGKEAGALRIVIPAGVTKLGFINNGEISLAGRGWRQTYGGERTLKHRLVLGSNDLDSDGLSLELDKELVLTIPEKENEASETVGGALKVDVPEGFRGCSLAGMTGSVVVGEVEIERNESTDAKEPKFHITYGDMKIK